MAARKTLTHLGVRGEARMVDVAAKAETERVAVAEGRVIMQPATLDSVLKGDAKKGDVLGAARIAGIMAAKRTHELIPLCHPIALSAITVEIEPDDDLPGLRVRATAKVADRTGVEMEALTSVAVAGLTLHDMVKAVDPAAVLTDVRVLSKSGGKSGARSRPAQARTPRTQARARPGSWASRRSRLAG